MAAILLVEPNVAFRRMMEQLLRQSGHEVFGADDADTAGRHLKDHELELVIMEMKLPGAMQGMEFLEWMRDVPPPGDPGRIALSSVSVLAQQEAYFRAELQLDGFLVKPFKPSAFKATIEKALAARAERPRRDWRDTNPGVIVPPPPVLQELEEIEPIPLESNPGLVDQPAPTPQEFETSSGDDTISLEELASPPPFQERRSMPRFPVRLPCAVHDGKNPFRARTENLAHSGAFITTDRQLVEGATVRIRLELPSSGPGFNEIVCTVVHVVPDSGFGVRFNEVPKETSARLDAFLEELRKPADARPFLVVASQSMSGQVEALAQQFSGDEMRVRFVKAGDDVRTAAENEPPDLILVDLADPMLVAHIGALKSARQTARIPVGLVDFTRSTQATLVAAAAAADKFFVLPEDNDRLMKFSVETLNASRRRSVRVKYQRPVTVRRAGAPDDRGAGVDLSETGVQIRLAIAPPENTPAHVILRLSDDDPPLVVPAKVQWVTPAGDEADLAYRVGFLLEPDDAARSRIRDEVRRALTASYYVRWLSRAPKPAAKPAPARPG